MFFRVCFSFSPFIEYLMQKEISLVVFQREGGRKLHSIFSAPGPPSSGAKETTNIGDQNFSCFPFVTRQQQQIIVFVQHSIKLLKNVRIFLTQGRYIYFGDDFMNGLRDICMLICNTLLY